MEKSVQPTLVIGLGGTGTLAVSVVKELANQYYIDPAYSFPLLRFLAIDTEFITTSGTGAVVKKPLRQSESTIDSDSDHSYEQNYNITLNRYEEQQLLEINPTAMNGWLERPNSLTADDFVDAAHMKDVRRAVRGMGAGGFGIVGKLALWQHCRGVINKIRTQLSTLNDSRYIRDKLNAGYLGKYRKHSNNYFNIFVITSFGGGTGKGAFLPVGVIVNELLKKMDPSMAMWENSLRFLINYMPSCFTVSGRNVGERYISTIQANQYASYRELEHVLNYGYPLEEKLKKDLSVNTDSCEKIFTNVINVSAQKDPSGEYIGDYHTINRCVADFILTYTFGDIVNNIRAYFSSNQGQHILSNPIKEDAAPAAARVRDYGRIGRYKLTFPVDRLVRYAKAHCGKEVLEDMLVGDLNIGKSGPKIKPMKVASDISGELFRMAGAIIDLPPYFSFADVQTNCETFDDPWLPTIQDLVKGKLSTVKNIFAGHGDEKKDSPFEKEQRPMVSRHLDKITETLQAYVKENGLIYAGKVVDELRTDMEGYLTDELENELNSLDNSNSAENRMSFATNAVELLNKLQKDRNGYAEELGKYADGGAERFKAAAKALKEDKKQWTEKNNRFLVRWGIKRECSKSMDKAESHLQGIVASSRRVYEQLGTAGMKYGTLSTLLAINDGLDVLQATIRNNVKCLEDRDGNSNIRGGLILVYKEKAKKIFQEPSDSLELRIGYHREEEFKAFAEALQLEDRGNVIRFLEGNLNHYFADRLITETLSPADLKKVVDIELGIIDRELKPGFSICNQLRQMNEETVRGFFNQLKDNSSLLGMLDSRKVVGGGTSVGAATSVLQMEDPELARLFPEILGEIHTAYSENKEDITLTTVETALPQFVFSELYTAQKKYFDLTKENSTKAKLERHTHKAFIRVEEPFGSTSQVPEEDMSAFVNFLLHIGVMRLENGFIQYKSSPYHEKDNRYEFFLDDRSQESITVEERKLHIDDFVMDINKNNNWFTYFSELVRRRLTIIFELENNTARESGRAYLTRYVVFERQTKGFPYIPDVLISFMQMYKEQRSSHRELVRFLNENTANNTFKAARFKADKPEDKLCHSPEELLEIFDAPDWRHFTREFERKMYHLHDGEMLLASDLTLDEVVQRIAKAQDRSGLKIWDGRAPKTLVSYSEFPKICKKVEEADYHSPEHLLYGRTREREDEINRLIKELDNEEAEGADSGLRSAVQNAYYVGQNGNRLDQKKTIQEIIEILKTDEKIFIWDAAAQNWVGWRDVADIADAYARTRIPPPPVDIPPPPTPSEA